MWLALGDEIAGIFDVLSGVPELHEIFQKGARVIHRDGSEYTLRRRRDGISIMWRVAGRSTEPEPLIAEAARDGAALAQGNVAVFHGHQMIWPRAR